MFAYMLTYVLMLSPAMGVRVRASLGLLNPFKEKMLQLLQLPHFLYPGYLLPVMSGMKGVMKFGSVLNQETRVHFSHCCVGLLSLSAECEGRRRCLPEQISALGSLAS